MFGHKLNISLIKLSQSVWENLDLSPKVIVSVSEATL